MVGTARNRIAAVSPWIWLNRAESAIGRLDSFRDAPLTAVPGIGEMRGLGPGFLDRGSHCLRVGGLGHDVGLPIEAIVNYLDEAPRAARSPWRPFARSGSSARASAVRDAEPAYRRDRKSTR